MSNANAAFVAFSTRLKLYETVRDKLCDNAKKLIKRRNSSVEQLTSLKSVVVQRTDRINSHSCIMGYVLCRRRIRYLARRKKGGRIKGPINWIYLRRRSTPLIQYTQAISDALAFQASNRT